jgi:hypothetical protein
MGILRVRRGDDTFVLEDVSGAVVALESLTG